MWCHNEVLQNEHVYVTSPSSNWRKQFPTVEADLLVLRRTDPCAFFERIFSMNHGRDHCGFKTHFGKQQNWKLTQLILENVNVVKVVLHRTNVLAAYSSYSAATQDGAWNPKKMQRTERSLVQFSKSAFLQYRGNYEERYQNIFATLRGQSHFVFRFEELNESARISALLQFLGACPEVAEVKTPAVRGPRDVLSRFSNPENAENFLREHGLMHWSREDDVVS